MLLNLLKNWKNLLASATIFGYGKLNFEDFNVEFLTVAVGGQCKDLPALGDWSRAVTRRPISLVSQIQSRPSSFLGHFSQFCLAYTASQ